MFNRKPNHERALLSREAHLQLAIDLQEEALAEAIAFEAKGNKARAKEALNRALEIEAKAFN